MSEKNERAGADQLDSESSPIIGSESPVAARPKRTWNAKGKKNLIIVGVILFIAAVLSVLLFAGGKKSTQQSDLPENTRVDAPGMASAEDRAQAKQDEEEKIRIAKGARKSAIENSGDTQLVDESHRPEKERQTQQTQPTNTTERLNGQGQQQAQPDNRRLQAIQDQAKMMMTGWGLSSESRSDNDRAFVREVKQSAGASTSGTAAASNGSAQTAPSVTDDQAIIVAYQTAYTGEIMSNFDSDAPTKARARVMTGPLSGAVLLGTAQRMGDGVHYEFTQSTYKGKVFKVLAEAIDEKTASEMVEGNYNGRYMERFVFPVISKGITAYASAKAQTGTQVVINNSGVAAQSTPAPTNQQAINAMIAAGADETSKALSASNQQSQVTVDKGKLVGIRFMENVYASDINGAKK
jgi:hypothetical protein